MEVAQDKLEYLRNARFGEVDFRNIRPDAHANWLDQSENDYDDLLPLVDQPQAVFGLFSNGLKSQRDEWVYDRSRETLEQKMRFFIDTYRATLNDREYPERMQIKWDRELTKYLDRKISIEFRPEEIVPAIYRPYDKIYLYFNRYLNGVTYRLANIFPSSQASNNAIWFKTGMDGHQYPLAVDAIPDVLPAGGSICMPRFRYMPDGQRVDNITDWALAQFQTHYADTTITRDDIFHYVYAVLHHPAYRQKYEINLKREFPRIPFYEDFRQWATWGEEFMALHLGYETVEPWPLVREDRSLPALGAGLPGPKPRLSARKDAGVIEIDAVTTLRGVPAEAWAYRLGTYTALEWVLERHKERTPKDPTIRERFNTYRFADHKERVIDMLMRVCRVSVETMRIVRQMP